ncbi:uncharacterized protein LOC114937374, partial [Nylanderia fulva]|uniref:uncharacterized protein LOC114937374 n=1 Tax=Nylanderia fulva TaxID=613905 RepID=UPI0010FAF617
EAIVVIENGGGFTHQGTCRGELAQRYRAKRLEQHRSQSWSSDPRRRDGPARGRDRRAASSEAKTQRSSASGRPPLGTRRFHTENHMHHGNEEMMSEGGDHESWDDEMMMNETNETPLPVLSYMSKDDSTSDQEKKAPSTPSNSNAANLSIPEQFRDVVKMNDYLTTGRRQEFWEEPFTRRVMDAIKSKELEMKTAAEILGVSYGTLYGRYRDSYGCLKHPYRVRDFWSEPGPAEVLAKLRRKEITLFRAAEFLNVTVHTLATYLSTLQGPDRISLAGDLASGGNIDGSGGNNATTTEPVTTENNESVNDILQKINANTATTTTTSIKREGGGYIEVPATVTKAATSMLENNPDITIVKSENTPRKRDYAKISNTENNNAKLMSGGAVSEVSQQQQQQQQQQKLADPLSLNNDNSKP